MDVVDEGFGAVEGTRSSVMLRGSSLIAVFNMVLPMEVKEIVLQYGTSFSLAPNVRFLNAEDRGLQVLIYTILSHESQRACGLESMVRSGYQDTLRRGGQNN